ncbi:MAG: riboflavin synthase, partial [Planctomycetaceae bacterium]|nr:riboflavin synthase [Planctomycetaceae bacterium]
MFTGLVEGMGTVAAVESQVVGVDLVIQPPNHMEGTAHDPVVIGASVAINGCCLTVVSIEEAGWRFQAGTETLS